MKRLSGGVISACAICAVAGSVTAEPTWTLASPQWLPMATTAGRTMDAEIADLDGDGRPELILAMEFGQNVVLTWTGSRFEHAWDALPQNVQRDSEDIAVADLNGDGLPDLVFASEDDRTNELYMNQGGLRFAPTDPGAPFGGVSNAVVAHDVDQDGDADLVFGNRGANVLLLNDGRGVFTVAEGFPGGDATTQDLEFGDLNGDGHADLLEANEQANRVLLGDGKGGFVDVTAELLGDRDREETREADLGDVDGDGDLDAVFANVGWAQHPPRDALLLNDGSGRLEPAPDGAFPAAIEFTIDLDFVDLDGDGDLDLLGARVGSATGPGAMLFLNDGSGVFQAAAPNALPGGFTNQGIDAEAADIDGDGVLDLYLTNHAGSDVLLRGAP